MKPAVIALAFVPIANAGLASPARAATAPLLRPGVYRQVPSGGGAAMPVGNRLVFKIVGGRLVFSLDAVRPSDMNTGTTSGSVPLGISKATWTDKREFQRCRLSFVATSAGITVTQDFAYGDCGFGYGVHADGTYARTAPPRYVTPPRY